MHIGYQNAQLEKILLHHHVIYISAHLHNSYSLPALYLNKDILCVNVPAFHQVEHGIKKAKTNVPWGRGNGWVVFSMTELLEVLPEDHPKRNDLIEFLNTLCEGYLALQDDEGMWHQVLNDHESYPETSCTSMFIYAFSRGIRFGWLKNPEKYVKAIYKAWKGISKTSVDSNGNVYGVCRGSEFSFIADYYKYELGWNLNDTHGTGIVMLAGIEVIRLNKFLAE